MKAMIIGILIVTIVMRLAWITYKVYGPEWHKLSIMHKAKKCKELHRTEVVGEVVDVARRTRYNWISYLSILNRRAASYEIEEASLYVVYSPIVRFTVDEREYEIDAEDYSVYTPVVGRKAIVVYNPMDLGEAYVWIKKAHKGQLKVQKRDESYIYCSCGLKKDIQIPVALTDERATPGRIVVNRYGFYPLVHPEDQKKRPLLDAVEGKNREDYS